MRVSDWSSDVCSSDLAAAFGAVALLAGRLGASSGLRLGALAAVSAQALMIGAGATHSMPLLVLYSLVGGAGYSFLFSAGVTLVRSGRASCRERGLQYV